MVYEIPPKTGTNGRGRQPGNQFTICSSRERERELETVRGITDSETPEANLNDISGTRTDKTAEAKSGKKS